MFNLNNLIILKNRSVGMSFRKGVFISRRLLPVMLLALFFTISGCGGAQKEVKPDYDPAFGMPEGYSLKAPLNISVVPYEDKRIGIESKKKVADINATVIGLHSTEFLLDEEVSVLVTNAIRDQLNAAGFKAEVVSNAKFSRTADSAQLAGLPAEADMVLSGEIKRFNLKVAGRDKIEIELFTNITDRKNNRLIWSGKTIEEGDRYAGMMGNTKKGLIKYINRSLALNIKKILKDSEQALSRHLNKSPFPAAGAVTTGSPLRQMQTPAEQADSTMAAGSLKVISKPAGARFYIGDTYYGKTPMTIELNAGVYEITIKLKGFKDEKEKVAVRPGTTTELDVAFGD